MGPGAILGCDPVHILGDRWVQPNTQQFRLPCDESPRRAAGFCFNIVTHPRTPSRPQAENAGTCRAAADYEQVEVIPAARRCEPAGDALDRTQTGLIPCGLAQGCVDCALQPYADGLE